MTSDQTQRLTFVIPVAPPDHPAIRNYPFVETLLQPVVHSMLAQCAGDIRVVIACHKTPDFAKNLTDRVTCLDVSDHPAFATGRNGVGLDKGMKYVLGAGHAMRDHNPDFIMFADADDLIRRDLAQTIIAMPRDSHDGFVLKRGYHALLAHRPDRIALKAAFRVRSFDAGCGTCRIFRADALMAKLSGFDAAMHHAITSDIPRDSAIDAIDQAAHRGPKDDNLIRVIGRHAHQHPFFDLAPVNTSLAAKCCGHMNHVGHRHGAVHWQRITKLIRRRTFAVRFSLDPATTCTGLPDALAVSRGAWRILQRRITG